MKRAIWLILGLVVLGIVVGGYYFVQMYNDYSKLKIDSRLRLDTDSQTDTSEINNEVLLGAFRRTNLHTYLY